MGILITSQRFRFGSRKLKINILHSAGLSLGIGDGWLVNCPEAAKVKTSSSIIGN